MKKNVTARFSKGKKFNDLKALKHASSAKRGFALVITISLMILLVLIGVGMLTLSTISLRTASQETAMAAARANARMALMLAIGDLQRNAGPDQIVTARAEILDNNPAGNTVSGVSQPYWTGTWRTGAYGLDVPYGGQSKTQRSASFTPQSGGSIDKVKSAYWLVSDPNANNPQARFMPTSGFTPVTTGNGFDPTRNAVKLATNQGTDKATQDVHVPLVGITDPTKTSSKNAKGIVGSFGYWVADESLKAKVNIVDPTMASGIDAATKQTHFLAPQANAIQKISNKNSTLVKDVQKDFRTDIDSSQLAKTASYKTVGLLTSSSSHKSAITVGAQILNNFMPDITTESRSVIVDVKDGGLKKDLTSAFENSAPNANNVLPYTNLVTNYGYDSQSAYRNCASLSCPSAPSYGPVTDGLPWVALYTYYNTYKTSLALTGSSSIKSSVQIFDNVPLTPSVPTTVDSGGGNQLTSSLPITVYPRYVVASVTHPSNACGTFGGLFPELIASRMDIGLTARLATTVDSDNKSHDVYKFSVCYRPGLVLYNPYNCKLYCRGLHYIRRYRTGATTGDHFLSVWVQNERVITQVPLNQWTPHEGAAYEEYIYPGNGGAGDCDTLEPGETRVFYIAKDAHFTGGGKYASALAQAIGSGQPLRSCGNSGSDQGSFQYWNYADEVETFTNGLEVDPSTINVNNPDGNQQWVPGPYYQGTPDSTASVQISIDNKDTPGTTSYRTQCVTGFTYGYPDVSWPSTNATNGQCYYEADGPDETVTGSAFPAHLTIDAMRGNEYALCSYYIRTKGIKPSTANTDPNSPNQTYVNGTDVIPIFHGNAAYFSPFETVLSASRRELFITNVGHIYGAADNEVSLGPPGQHSGETWFGTLSMGVVDPSTSSPPRRVLRDVPGQPLLSIGQFMHIPTSVYRTGRGSEGRSRDPGSMYIGGSMCSPFIPTDKNAMVDSNTGTLLLDDSYMANDALFDRFFFSTVPPASPDNNAPQEWTTFNTNYAHGTLSPLPNSRIKPYATNSSLPLLSDLRDFDKAAANLMLDGAFNVNSTSVAAWTAFLSSLSGNSLRIWDAVANNSTDVPSGTLKNFIPRFWSGGTAGVGQPWSAGRALSEAEVAQLAAQIVQQVKTRGPFLSMSDFLNHRLNASGALGRVGCLQAAIDKSQINSLLKQPQVGSPVNPQQYGMNMTNWGQLPGIIPGNLKDGQDGTGSTLFTTYGMPGYLMQQDIVQAFSPAMTVRSDTFLIRAYGECVNPVTGEIQAKAWAEAVVQRVPAFVDSTADSDPSVAIPKDPAGNNNPVLPNVAKLTSAVNINLGRRFKVVGFRWLSSNEL